jgi:hypothetical protein
MVVHTCNPSTREAKAGRLQVLGQPELYSETQSQKKNRKQCTEGGVFLWSCVIAAIETNSPGVPRPLRKSGSLRVTVASRQLIYQPGSEATGSWMSTDLWLQSL